MRGHLHEYLLSSGEKRWAIVLYVGKRLNKKGRLADCYRWVRGFAQKGAAQKEMTKLLRSQDTGTYVESTNETLSEFLDRWLAHTKTRVTPKTFERYQQLVRLNIKPGVGDVKLSKLHPVQIADFYRAALESGRQDGKGGLSPRTVLHIHRLLFAALQQAVQWQIRPTNPAAACDPPRPEKKEMHALDAPRAAWLIQAAAGGQHYLPVVLALSTGLRRGEIFGLRWKDVDLVSGRMVVTQSLEQTKGQLRFKPPKNTKRRPLTLPRLAIEALLIHREQQQRAKQLYGADYQDHDLILSMEDGQPAKPNNFSSAYARFKKKIGLAQIRFHDLRHSSSSQLLKEGVPVKTVSARLGHSSASMTLDVYGHCLGGDDEQAAEIMDRTLRRELDKLTRKV